MPRAKRDSYFGGTQKDLVRHSRHGVEGSLGVVGPLDIREFGEDSLEREDASRR